MSTPEEIVERAKDYLRARYWALRERYLPGQDALPALIEAEQALWKALSGEWSLIDAYRAIGGKMAEIDERKKLYLDVKPMVKREVTKRPTGGFFPR